MTMKPATPFFTCSLLIFLCVGNALSQSTQTTKQSPCKSRQELQQFNFWIGEWDVKQTGAEDGPSVGSSRIESFVDGCIILENWESPGFTGKSWNFFDRGTNKWRQIWIDISGRKAEFSGEFKDKAMRFEGEAVLANGNKVKNRMTFFLLDPDKVRQLAERTSDGGVTWVTTVDFTYLRKK